VADRGEFIRIWSEIRCSLDVLDEDLKDVGIETVFTAEIRGFVDELCEAIGKPDVIDNYRELKPVTGVTGGVNGRRVA
jgi:hypothetical protein